jgi:hypothetical protein
MAKVVIRGTLAVVLVVSAAAISAALCYAQSLTGAAPGAESSAQSPIDIVSTPIVFGKLSVFGKGQSTTTGVVCADAPCPLGDTCTGCVSWSGLILQGGFNGVSFTAPTLTGDLTADITHEVTSGSGTGICFQGAGPATVFTNAAKTASIKMNLIGQFCTANPTNASVEFAGSYLITGGTGKFSSASGAGTFTADANEFFTTSRHTVQMNGTLLY